MFCVAIRWDLGAIETSKVTKRKKHLEQLAGSFSASFYFTFKLTCFQLTQRKANSWRLEAPTCYQTQQATQSHFVMIQLLLILMTNAGRLEDRKKRKKKTNKQTNKQKTEKFVHWIS